jgi:hypothetical protein
LNLKTHFITPVYSMLLKDVSVETLATPLDPAGSSGIECCTREKRGPLERKCQENIDI